MLQGGLLSQPLMRELTVHIATEVSYRFHAGKLYTLDSLWSDEFRLIWTNEYTHKPQKHKIELLGM